jgi:nitroreductase
VPAAAAGWVAAGHTAHYALVPAHDRNLLDAWFRLGFGSQHVHAIRGLPAACPAVPAPVTIRRARLADLDTLATLDVALSEHLRGSPVFSATTVPRVEDARAEWERDFDDPDYTTFVAERDGRVIGSAIGCALTNSGLHHGLAHPDNAWFNATLQAAYFIIGVRAAGLAAGPLGGFDAAGVDREFFPDGQHKSLLIVNIGKPAEDAYPPRNPRLEYDEVVRTV